MQEAIKIKDLSHSYGNNFFLDKMSFSVGQGKLHGFLGPNGAGKTTTIKILSGLLLAQQGRFWINGFSLTTNKQQAQQSLGMMPEQVGFYPHMRLQEFLRFTAELYGVYTPAKIQEILEQVGLKPFARSFVGNLSKGYRQRVGLARALATEAPVLILDEPLAGLDPVALQDIRQLLVSLKGERTLFLSSHLLHTVGQMCDEVTILHQGRVHFSGVPDQAMDLEEFFLQVIQS